MVVAVLCLLTSWHLLQGKRWAWWSSLVLTVMVFAFGGYACWAAFYSTDPYMRSEAIFVLGIGIALIVPSITAVVLLTLPSVRRHYGTYRTQSHSSENRG